MATKYQEVFSNAGAPTSVPCTVAGGVIRTTVVDVDTDSTTVSATPALLYGVFVNTALSAHTCPIQDNATAVLTLAASLAAGTNYFFGAGIPFLTSMVVNPNDAGTGSITVLWAPL